LAAKFAVMHNQRSQECDNLASPKVSPEAKPMKRRKFIALLGGAAAWPLGARAQQAERIRMIGILVPVAAGAPEWQRYVAVFREALQKLGWSDGHDVRIEERWGGGGEEIERNAAELIQLMPNVILGAAASAARALHQATRTVPIVFANVPDPVALGLVSRLAPPGGNITGFANYEPAIAVKWLELLTQIAPSVARVAFIFDPVNPAVIGYLREMEAAASSFRVHVSAEGVHNAEDIQRALNTFSREPGGGLVVANSPATATHKAQMIALAARNHLPAVYPTREFVKAGGLVSYGIDTADLFRSAASYVNRILKSEKPGDLPVQFATKFELLINLQTAKALGLDPPIQLLARTDEVIE
jgi:putative ABC transport system substrate-binding protein